MGLIAPQTSSSFKGTYHDIISPLKKDYDLAIEQALKVDHQIYTEDKLKPFAFGNSPALPGITNLITSPYLVITNIYNLVKGEITGRHPAKVEAGVKIVSNSLGFVNALLTTLKYAITFKLMIAMSVAITPILLATGLVISCLEIAVHSYKLKKGKDFQKLITKDLFDKMIPLKKAAEEKYLNRPKTQRFASYLLKQVKSSKTQMEKEYGKEFVETFLSKLNLIKNYSHESSKRSDMQIRTLVQETFDDYNRVFCLNTFKNIHKEFMKISEKRKNILIRKANKNFYNMPYEKALAKSLARIQNDFKKKKIKLGSRVEPWVAAEFSNKYNAIVQKLESTSINTQKSGIKEGARVILKMREKSNTNQVLHTYGIIAFASILTGYALSTFVPMLTILPVIFMVVATAYSMLYYLIKKGVAESRTNNFDHNNCIPNWIKWIGSKFTTSKAEAETKVIKATNLTREISKVRRLA